MKKTVSVNIKGLNFMIEEDAYELLHQYMQRLEKNLANQKGSKDIIEDIELRIAELCQGRLSDKKQVIEIEDIQQIIATLGQPEDFIDEEEEIKTETKDSYSYQQTVKDKQLYRDIEHAKIAGVCAGLSNYFNIDLIVVRIIFLILLFFGGSGFPMYLILWLVVPKANSTIDRLRMQGKPITVDSVKEEFEQAADRIKNSSKSFADKIRKDENYSKRFSSLGRLITKILGIGFIATGIFFLVIFIVLFFGGLKFIPIQSNEGHIGFSELSEVLLSDSNDVIFTWVGIFLIVSSVVLFFISNGTYLLIKVKSKWAKISTVALIIFGIIGFSMCFIVGTNTAREFGNYAELEKKIGSLNADFIELKVEFPEKNLGEGLKLKHLNRFDNKQILVGKNKIEDYGIDIKYLTSKDSLYHIYQNLSANSDSYQNAMQKAKNINHSIEINGKNVQISPKYSFPKRDKIRAQRVSITIEIPFNKNVFINNKKINLQSLQENNEHFGYLNQNGEFDDWD